MVEIPHFLSELLKLEKSIPQAIRLRFGRIWDPFFFYRVCKFQMGACRGWKVMNFWKRACSWCRKQLFAPHYTLHKFNQVFRLSGQNNFYRVCNVQGAEVSPANSESFRFPPGLHSKLRIFKQLLHFCQISFLDQLAARQKTWDSNAILVTFSGF